MREGEALVLQIVEAAQAAVLAHQDHAPVVRLTAALALEQDLRVSHLLGGDVAKGGEEGEVHLALRDGANELAVALGDVRHAAQAAALLQESREGVGFEPDDAGIVPAVEADAEGLLRAALLRRQGQEGRGQQEQGE